MSSYKRAAEKLFLDWMNRLAPHEQEQIRDLPTRDKASLVEAIAIALQEEHEKDTRHPA